MYTSSSRGSHSDVSRVLPVTHVSLSTLQGYCKTARKPRITARAIRILGVRVGGARKGKGEGEKYVWCICTGFCALSGMQLQVHHTRLSHDQFTLHKVNFQLVEEVMAIGSAGNIHCCLCEAIVDAKERRSVATTMNLLKDTVVDVAVFNRNSKLCRRCHRKLVATAKLKADLAGRTKELRKQIVRAGERASVQLWRRQEVASSSKPYIQAFQVKKLLFGV